MRIRARYKIGLIAPLETPLGRDLRDGVLLAQELHPLASADEVVGPEGPRMEVPVPPGVVVGLHGQVAVGQQAVGHHEVVGLVTVGAHLHVHLPRRREVDREDHNEEEDAA